MPLNIAKYFDLTATQGGADAFIETSVATGIESANGVILKLSLVEVKFPASTFYTLAADMFMGWSLTRDTKATIVNYDDADCLMAGGTELTLITSGCVNIPNSYLYAPPDGIFMAEPTLYFQLDSTGTGAANVAYVRIHYTEVKASEIDILRLLNNA
jgi:hypothetical protein